MCYFIDFIYNYEMEVFLQPSNQKEGKNGKDDFLAQIKNFACLKFAIQ